MMISGVRSMASCSTTHLRHRLAPYYLRLASRCGQRQEVLLIVHKRFAASVPGSNLQIRIPKDKLVPEDSEMAQPVALEDLPRAQQRFAKEFEKMNYERIKDIFRKNKKNIIGLIVMAAVVVGIYYYTVHAVKQETFLEEIDEEVAAEKGEVPKKE